MRGTPNLTGRLRRWLAALASMLVAMLVAGPAWADLPAYNDAIKRGDLAAAVAEAAAIWPQFDKSKPEAAQLAREFAWSALLAGDHVRARDYAQWLATDGAALGVSGTAPTLANVLLRWAELSAQPSDAARKAMADAMEAHAASSSAADAIATVAANRLYSADWMASDWAGVERDAALGVQFALAMGEAGRAYLDQGRLNRATAGFLLRRDADSYMALADLHDELADRLGTQRLPSPDTMDERLYERSEVWLAAMSSYFETQRTVDRNPRAWQEKYGAAMERGLKGRCASATCDPALAPPEGQLPTCRSAFRQTPPLSYPRNARFSGLVGAMRLLVRLDDKGTVTDIRLLASAPSDSFYDGAAATVRRWKLERSPTKQAACTLAGYRVLDLQYVFR